MEILEDLVKILLPAAIVLYGMYLIAKNFLTKDFERKLAEMKLKNTETVLPIRLQAYERIALFLERIAPANLVIRVNDPEYNSAQLQQVLVNEVRNEFNHNLSQQVYMSDAAWSLVRFAKDDVINLISEASREVDASARGMDLAANIFEKVKERKDEPVDKALRFLKSEIQKVF